MMYNGEDGRLARGVKMWKTKRLLLDAMHVSLVTEHKLFKAGMAASRAAILAGRNLGYVSQLQYDTDYRPFATYNGEHVPRHCGNLEDKSGKYSCVRPNAGETILPVWGPSDAVDWIGSRRLWVIDSGSSVNTSDFPKERIEKVFKKH